MNQVPDEPTCSTATKSARRPTGAYDEPTAEKIAFGKRMKEARDIAGMSQAEAAEAMGYSQAVQLSLMESGQRMPTVRVLVHCCAMYGTTMDYLCGLTADGDRDPVAAVQREVAARVVGEVRALIAAVTVGAATAVRELRPDAGRTARLAGQVVELAAVLDRVQARGGEAFADLPAGALLVRRTQAALSTAHETLAAVARAQRAAGAAPVDMPTTAGIDLPDAADLAELAGRLTRPLQVAAGDSDEADDEPANTTDTNEDAQPCPHNAA
jgi:transcriptional regulator with XRE-family HTH domain